MLAVPVLAILDWMERLAPIAADRDTLVTDVGSTKLAIAESAAQRLFNRPDRAQFLARSSDGRKGERRRGACGSKVV